MNIDRFIARFIPIIGAVFFIIGLGYLIYTSVWLTIAYEAKIGVGAFASVLLIGAGYSFRESMRFYADVIVWAGILLFYGTLVYASRTTDLAVALLPEQGGLIVSLLFSLAVAYFASERRSKEILILSLLGAYLTPFVIGQEDTWQYEIAYNVYLLYFFAVNLGIFALSRRLWIGDVVPANAIGLLIGTTSLHVLTQTDDSSIGILGSDLGSGIISVGILVTYIAAMTLSSSSFPDKFRQFFSFGYIVPLLWFTVNAAMLDIPREGMATLYAGISAAYFGCWYLARANEEHATGRAFLYAGGIVAICLAALGFFSDERLYAGLAIAGASLILWAFAMVSPMRERVASYAALGIVGLILTAFAPDTLAGSRELTILAGTTPLLLAWFMRVRVPDSETREALQLVGLLSSILAALVGISLLVDRDVPFDLLLWTIPGVCGLTYLFIARDSLSSRTLENWFVLGAILISTGYFLSFFTLVDRIHPFPETVGFWNSIALTGALSTIGYFLALEIRRKVGTNDPEQKPSYPLALAAYSTLLLTIHHQALALMNDLGADFSDGTKNALTTPLWIAIAIWMMYSGIRGGVSHRPEKVLGVSLLGLTLLKILFFDLDGATTQVRIIVLMIVGGGLMAFSYVLSRKGYLSPDMPDESDTADSTDESRHTSATR